MINIEKFIKTRKSLGLSQTDLCHGMHPVNLKQV